ncbi:hypothetical protein BJ878DRAFT_575216 [Calycina marina]|uniref:Uncharacterized protein n=1 Tax=Calycina marina TaxID=1763456 RepID=A0A9P8CFD0_9HELO|nr:hypothetical protein BJ878DRAFT_575216 [Calycina marina]
MDALHPYLLALLSTYNTTLPHLSHAYHKLSSHYTTSEFSQMKMTPYLDTLAYYTLSSPTLLVVLAVLATLFIVRVILGWIWRTVVFWLRVLFWGALVLGAAVAWQRGVESTARDVVGAVRELVEFWWSEFERFEGMQEGRGGQWRTQ